MFDIGFPELLIIGIVALIVVGPKDLPGMFHAVGRFTARAKSLGREFTRAMNDAADTSGLNDISKGLKGVSSPKSFAMKSLNDAVDSFEKWDPNRPSGTSKGPDPLPKERAEAAQKIKEAGAKAATERKAREAEAAKAAASTATAKASDEARQSFQTRQRPTKNTPVRKAGSTPARRGPTRR